MRDPSTRKPSGGGHPVGESHNQPFQSSFNMFLHADFQGSRVTSNGGPLPVGELDERPGLTGLPPGVAHLLRRDKVELGNSGSIDRHSLGKGKTGN